MKHLIVTGSLLLLLLGLPKISLAEGFVWVVESPQKNTDSVYLAGTIHLLSADDYPLPKVFDKAYSASNSLIFEMDLGLQTTPAFQQLMAQVLFYKEGQRLDKVLGDKVWAKFVSWCESNQLPVEPFLTMKPGLVAITISMTEMIKLGMTQEGVDSYFYQKALVDKKPLLGLETAEEQLGFLASMGGGRPDQLISQTLDESDEISMLLPKIKQAWREGDASGLNTVMVLNMRQDYPDIYQSLLVDRNQAWLPKIEKEINDKGSEFILVGAAHLVGKDGLLAQLKAKGYTVTAMQ